MANMKRKKKKHGIFKKEITTIQLQRLYKECSLWIKTINSEEKRAIRKYTRNSLENQKSKYNEKFFNKLNSYLRCIKENPNLLKNDNLEYYSNLISSAIDKYKLTEDTICYRSDNENIFSSYDVGDTFYPSSFFSTSATIYSTLNGNYKTVIFAKSGSCCAFVGPISRHKKQNEILFDKTVKYKIKSKENNRTFLEVIK